MSAEFACYSYGFHVRNRWKAQFQQKAKPDLTSKTVIVLFLGLIYLLFF